MPDPNNIVHSETKTAWLCVPKNANTSIKTALRQWLGLPIREDTYAHHNLDFVFATTKSVATAFKHYYRVGVVRDPLARAASAWKYTCVDNPGWWESIPHDFGMKSGMTFAQFVDVIASQYDEEMNIHYRPQTSMLMFRGKPAYDHLCRMENIVQDWAVVQKRIPGLPALAKQRVSGVAWAAAYTPKLREAVRCRYAEDFLRFNYPVYGDGS